MRQFWVIPIFTYVSLIVSDKVPINVMHICMEVLQLWDLPANADFAVDFVNAKTFLLPNHELKLYHSIASAAHAQEDLGPVVKAFIDQISQEPSKFMVLGPTFSSQAKVILEASAMYNLPEIAYTVTSPIFSDASKYARFVRVMEVTKLHNPAILHILNKFDWTRAAKIVFDSEFVLPVATDLQNSLDGSNFTILASATYSSDPQSQIKQLQDSGATIFLSFGAFTSYRMFCEAYRHRLYGPRYQWIHWSGRHGLLYELDNSTTFLDGCSVAEVSKAMEGTIYFVPEAEHGPGSDGTNMVYGQTVDDIRTDFAQYLESIGKGDTEAHVFMPYVFDAVLTIASAVNRTLAIVDDPKLIEEFYYGDSSTSQVLYEQLKSAQISGATGDVYFDENGDRNTKVTIGQVRDGKGIPVAMYDPLSDSLTYFHGKTFIFEGGSPPLDKAIVDRRQIRKDWTLFVIFTVLSVVGVSLCVISVCFNFAFRKARIIKMSSPRINSLVALGCCLSYISVVLFGLDRQFESPPDWLCTVRVWTLTLGFTLSFGSMFSKTWRVHVLFTNTKLQRKVVKDWQLFVLVLILLALDLLLLLIWAGLDPMQWKLNILSGDQTEENGVLVIPQITGCSSRYMTYWTSATYVFKALLLLFGIFFAWETRKVQIEALNDSKQIGMCVYNVVIMSVLTVPLVNLLSAQQVSIIYGITGVSILMCSTSTLVFVFGTKMHFVWINRGRIDDIDVMPFNHTSTSVNKSTIGNTCTR